jgi:fatty-acyl-CoA synthase
MISIESEKAGQAASRNSSATKAWVRALELTAPIVHNPQRILPIVIEELAEKMGDAPALLSERECLSYRALAERSNNYARWALDQGLAKGDTVCLLMPNQPEYMAIWLGITRVGGVVALLNTNLTGPSLAHCINIVEPKHLIVTVDFIDRLTTSVPNLEGTTTIWTHGVDHNRFSRIDREIGLQGSERINVSERQPTIEDPALYLYTSGTTGLPKAARVSHYRLMQWSHWFAGMTDTRSEDRMYNCLPMYHGVGGVLATGVMLVSGGSVLVREKFSAREFWSDIVRWDCTLFQYIGELCRYLLHADVHPHETEHRIRLCCGNGLRGDIWNTFKNRFQIPRILEFYATTEGVVSLTNFEEKPGSIGRIPPYLAHRFPVTLVQFDIENNVPIRNDQGFCIRCATNETGEAIGKIFSDPLNLFSQFDGYNSEEASEKKILRNVFELGDAWFRTGDLMRKDEKGYFYFVDRIGDTFRWKGENVATSEVSEAICTFPGVKEAVVYGVTIPGTDGRAGMAALVIDKDLDLVAFHAYLISRLPKYACPLFLRIRNEIEITGTFRQTKNTLVQQGYEPVVGADVIYFNDPGAGAFVRLDKSLYDRIQTGKILF